THMRIHTEERTHMRIHTGERCHLLSFAPPPVICATSLALAPSLLDKHQLIY
ncbi:hypothetical protein DPMN_063149, partial [Dreissena polymorpha]